MKVLTVASSIQEVEEERQIDFKVVGEDRREENRNRRLFIRLIDRSIN